MNEINADYVLGQIRSLHAALEHPATEATRNDESPEFGAMLKGALDKVNDMQAQAGELKTAFEMGEGDAGLAEVMIASQKADLSFRAMTEVRNKLVTAYQDIMNMPV